MDTQLKDYSRLVFVDVAAFIILFISEIYVAKFVKPRRRGFFCDDESIRYPLHKSTVPSLVLNIVGITLPLFLIVVFEYRDFRRKKKSGPIFKVMNYPINSFHWNLFRMTACYGSGALFNQFLTDIGKKVIGRLRPNFLSVCKMNIAEVCKANNFTYIEDYTCMEDEYIVDSSRVSFPSGHSSFSFYVAVFLVLYLQKHLRTRTILVKPIIQFTCIAVAYFVALSRVMDNKHHWSDVLVGIFLGCFVCIINYVFIHRMFRSDVNSHSANESINGVRTTNVREAHDEL